MLGDAGMVLRDPSTAHLLAHQVPPTAHASTCQTTSLRSLQRHSAPCCMVALCCPVQGPSICRHSLQVVRRLDAVVAAESSPGDDGELLFVTRLLQLGAATKAQLRARRCSGPAPRSSHSGYQRSPAGFS